ncbi:MAG TPA: hypothetical protein PLY93_02590 [Turneriella sp.]|nr:hypothetical protein [Turneriella sp.]
MRRAIAVFSVFVFLAGPIYSECNPPASILATCSSSTPNSSSSSNSSISFDPKISSSLLIIGVTVLIGIALFYYLKDSLFKSSSAVAYHESTLYKSFNNLPAARDAFAVTRERLAHPIEVGFQNWNFNLPGLKW